MVTALKEHAAFDFVASRLAEIGLDSVAVADPEGGTALVVRTRNGASLCLQVSVSGNGGRNGARGGAARRYEWNVRPHSAGSGRGNRFLALVSLDPIDETPEVFIVPAGVVTTQLNGRGRRNKLAKKYRPHLAALSRFKNNWKSLQDYLKRIDRRTIGKGVARADIEEAKLMAEARRDREAIDIFLTGEQIDAAKRWGRP